MPNGFIPNSHSAVSRVELNEDDSINLADRASTVSTKEHRSSYLAR